MKRSEVLNELYRLLHCGPDYPTEDEILTKLEELGMKPPVAKHCPVLLTTSHTWEPEDERNAALDEKNAILDELQKETESLGLEFK